MPSSRNAFDPDNRSPFNGEFLAYLIVCGALSIFFLLYFNRVFASVVSWAIRTWTWHQYRVYIDIQALQISLLGGRVFFTGLRYHGNNETVLIQNGYITWSYWLRRVRDVDIRNKKEKAAEEAAGIQGNDSGPSSRLPCRVNVSVLGVEWFVYNRTPAYDTVLAGLTDDGDEEGEPSIEPQQEAGGASSKLRRRRSKRGEGSNGLPRGRSSEQTELNESKPELGKQGENGSGPHRHSASHSSSSSDDEARGPDSTDHEYAIPLMLRLFPINVECQTAGLVMGNENTKAVLIVKADAVSGDIDASDTDTPDPYRQLFRLKFKHPVIEMRDNQDFKENQADRAVREKGVAQHREPVQTKSYFRRQRRRIMGQIRGLVPYWRKSVESFSSDSRTAPGAAGGPHPPGLNHWQGLSRYLDDSEDQKARWASVEYAALPTILDSPEASMTIYWDVVSKVGLGPARSDDAEKFADNINGEEPPAWAINLSIKGGSVNYGPWADRQRAELQRTFFPTMCKDARPAKHLPVGAARVPTQFKLYIELEEETTIRVPTREESKNWRWKGKEPELIPSRGRDKRIFKGLNKKTQQTPQTLQRPYGWLDIKVAANSTVSYSMDMFASASGYSNTLHVDLPKTEISSSINHELLWRSGAQRISCDLSTPLRWNSLRQWHFKVASEDLELFLLRDHVFLLIDLVDDWTTGPPAEYLVFAPFKYHLDLQLQNVKLYLNVSDANIINNPTDMEDNTYIVIGSPLLSSTTCIPVDKYRPSKNAIPFDIRADTATVGIHVPPWNTQATFLPSTEIGDLENLLVDGSYHYNATTSLANTDTLVLNVTAKSPAACIHGFVLRYFLKLKDNYFGDDIHFRTLEEYQESLRLKEKNPDSETVSRPPHKQSNDLDVMVNLRLDDCKVLLPSNLYASTRHAQIDTPSLSCDLRFTNYYMDMELVVDPLSLSPGNSDGGMETPISATSSTQLFIDGIKLYGHRLFGLPPTEPTYLCNWDISVGDVTGECSADFLASLISGGKAFGFSFDDDENALVSYSSVIFYDVTFLRAFVQSVNLWLHVEEAAFLLSTGLIDVKYNDWARSHYSRRANIRIPDVKLSCVNSESVSRSKSRSHRAVEADALVRTSVHLAIIGRKFDFSNERKLQQELVRREDQRTHRTGFLCLPGLLDELIPDPVDPPAQCFPDVPQPTGLEHVQGDGSSHTSSARSRHPRGLRHKSSFLSFSSASECSIVRPQSSRLSGARGKRPEYLQPFAPLDQRPGRAGHPAERDREVSASTGRHSAFYSAAGDVNDRHDAGHSSVAFPSQYLAPYFPFERVKPDAFEARMQGMEDDDDDAGDDTPDSVGFDLEDIDADMLSEDCVSSSTLVEFPAGLTAFFNPQSLRYVAALIAALQPSEPDDILDAIQVDSMEEIFGMQRAQKMKGQVKDVFVRLPRANIRFINVSDLDSPEPSHEEQDQYDFSITKLVLASRSETKWLDAFKPESKKTDTSFHLRLKSVELSAAERFHDMEGPQAAALAQIERVVVSMGSKDLTYLDADIGSIQGNISSMKLEYLASLIHRTNMLASDFGKLFAETASRERHLVRYLVHRLIKDAQAAPDPTFLIRPSAVLRSARQHLRTFDSWKIAMRLREMWTTLDPDRKEQLTLDCLGDLPSLPDDIRQQAVASFQRWRSWDLRDASASVLLNKIFGRSGDHLNPPSDEGPVMAVVRVAETRLVLDPGPKQNEITFLDLTARFETSHAPREEGGKAATDVPNGSLTVLNIYCDDASINLNWELCELADDILRLYNKIQAKPSPQSPPPVKSPPSPSPTGRQERTIHCVVSLGRGLIALETVNIHASSVGSGMKASFLLRSERENDVSDANFILSCDSVQSRLRSGAQGLVKLVLHKSSVLVSHELQAGETTDRHTIKATASSQDMSVVVKQDPVVLSEVLDAVIRDEVAQLHRLTHELPSSPVPSSPTKTIIDRLSAFRVNVAMFMDRYTISIPLLRSLTYTVSGTVSRAAMAANFGREIIFDFDVKENSHEMQIIVDNMPRSISLLQIPPTNGRVTSHMGHGGHSITIFASVELVQLDASAVYSLLTALNRPEISSVINDLQQQSGIIRERITALFGTDGGQVTKSSHQKKAEVLGYGVHLTFAGLEVFGSSPLKSSMSPMAHISFCLDSVNLEMTNRVEHDGPILAYPEVHINLRKVAFEIRRGTPDSLGSCGNLVFGALVTTTSRLTDDGEVMRFFNLKSDGFEISLSPDTVSTVVDVLGYMGDKFKDLGTSRELEYLRRIRQTKPRIAINDQEEQPEPDVVHDFLSSMTYTFEMRDIDVCWRVTKPNEEPSQDKDDLVLSLQRIEFGTCTRNSARLTIENLQLQMVSPLQDRKFRSPNSALLPEVIFNIAHVSTSDARRLAFQAVGKSLDLRLNSGFIIPAANLEDSITLSIKNVQQASRNWRPVIPPTASPAAPGSETEKPRQASLLGSRRLESLLVDADFAGAVVYLTSKTDPNDFTTADRSGRRGMSGKYGQFVQEDSGSTVLRSPGLACKMEYFDNGKDTPSLYGEVKIDASSNILYPSVVPLIMDITNTVKEVVSSESDEDKKTHVQPHDVLARAKVGDDDSILTADPSAVLGRLKLNLGLRIYKQEFSLSCQPIARVAATASFDDVYFTANTVHSVEQGNFFAISGAFSNLRASVQHVYSRESTGSFEVESIVLSLMNSKHVSGTSGVSAIMKVSPMKVCVNVKQLQDFLLFREIWIPREIWRASSAPVATLVTETSQWHLAQRYQQVAATAAFPWTATVSITALEINVDLGQALGKSVFAISEFWASSKKTSDWEQNLCLGFEKIGVDSTGRMSGFVALQNFQLRSSIKWPEREQALNETPLVQASIGFGQLRVKAAFDYQAFLVADITSMKFIMYNVRRSREGAGDRLVAMFDGEAVQVFGTTTSAAQVVALYQAFQRLIQEKKANYESSLKEIERFLKRKTGTAPALLPPRGGLLERPVDDDALLKSPILLDTNVVVTLKALNLGIFPSTFSDRQVFKMEALNAQARFAASIEERRIHSILGLTLGQLRIGLAGVGQRPGPAKTLSELSVEDVVSSATGSRGGTILKVPRVEASMQTWQSPDSKHIDYLFHSAFEGKVEVGWNYSRISYIRGMWANHAKALAQTCGRELPPVTAIRVTGVPEPQQGAGSGSGQQTKITAEVNVPQSKYEYTALEPPVIETPQLRDMGEATPPLEWIGLQRDRLPNLTHQIVIVSLLELASEVEDAYSRILGSS
ncbi:hypothetical protein QBC33DRAFT_591547 [Phialemonium atrogriseum]|uniref:Elongation factor 2 n=1 Tax=Phialemonium atrogriseum TaxID=1093897 RepID=A0AAJ0FKR7_9PEZI|nr:uncharacterized protein QBC33DRAFT_591547 [Phialemonium atrogriseum]KAK1771357.1 hypothetical protein QBC33DRAFT_591547 [Phialemonium atrogriseum]